jgi:hypothetical protein
MSPPEFIVPLEVPLQLGGAALTVRPATVGQIARLMHLAAPVVRALMTLPPSLLDRVQDGQIDADDVRDLFELLNDQPDNVLRMVAIATGLPQAQVDALPPDQFAYLFAVVMQVNADFFSRATPVFAAAGRVLRQVQTPTPTPTPRPSGPGPLAC